jgi:hypothetical protein
MAPAWYLLFSSALALVAMYLMTESAPARLSAPDTVIDAEPGLPPTA